MNETHDPGLKSWVESANTETCDFPIQNLPYGVFSRADAPAPRVGVAIGDQVLDLAAAEAAGLLPGGGGLFSNPAINTLMARGAALWAEMRLALSRMLRQGARPRPELLTPMTDATLHLPFEVTEYTDFYASREHATNVGSMFRDPANALMENWLHMPVGYNGRASTVVVSGTDIQRPCGQIKPPHTDQPTYAASAKLDIELEMGAVVGTPSEMGAPLSVAEADAMIFGYVLLNDWSARDVQVWEYQPLGPFQAKAFATTISPWVVTQEALAPFRTPGPVQDPQPLPYLRQQGPHNFDINLTVTMQPAGTTQPSTICRTSFKHMYWSSAQQLAHHAGSGCAMRTGDLLGSGTISGAAKGSLGSLLELTWNGRDPLQLADGSERTFIEDGDRLTLSGHCQGDGYRIGFGQAAGTVLPAAAV